MNKVVLILGWLWAVSVSSAAEPSGTIHAPARPPDFTGFTNAILLKPAENPNQTLVQKFAPLILQEVTDTNRVAEYERDLFRLGDALVVYGGTREIFLGGRKHDQVTYLWKYPDQSAENPAHRDALPYQGIRITLNQAGYPVIWEALADAGRQRAIYVAGSLEHAAWRRYGARLTGRKFAIEPDSARQPQIWIPLTLEDSTVAFGPFIYLHAGTRAAGTIICRCMPAQVKQVFQTLEYRLLPLAAAPADLASPAPASRIQTMLQRWEAADWERCLRLPAEF